MQFFNVFDSMVMGTLPLAPQGGEAYLVSGGEFVPAVDGFTFYEDHSLCAEAKPMLTIHERRYKWAVPDEYLASPPLEGRPFIHGVMDCYSALQDMYKQTYGVSLPDIERAPNWWQTGQNLYLDNAEENGFKPVFSKEVKPGMVFAMKVLSPVVNHVAVYIGNGLIYHHMAGGVSKIEDLRLAHRKWIDSIWQHNEVQ
ncbi:MAG: NlpC/P60 family protein [Pontibacterium sp.]